LLKPYLRVFRGVSKCNLAGYVGFFQFLQNFRQYNAFEQAELILQVALDSAMGRCLTGVDSRSKGLSAFVAIDAESNHEIMHALRLGEAPRAAHESLDPGPPLDVCALAVLGVLLPYVMLRGVAMPLVGSPPVRGELCDAKGLPQRWQPQEALSLPRSTPLAQPLPRVGINGMPQPAWMRFAAPVTPHCVQVCGAPTPSLPFLGAAHLHGEVRGLHDLSSGTLSLGEGRCLFLSSAMTVCVLPCQTRAVSRMPRALRAISTICCLTAGACPGALSSSRQGRPAPRGSRQRERGFPWRVVPWRTRSVP
jgi:hypothetical protein